MPLKILILISFSLFIFACSRVYVENIEPYKKNLPVYKVNKKFQRDDVVIENIDSLLIDKYVERDGKGVKIFFLGRYSKRDSSGIVTLYMKGFSIRKGENGVYSVKEDLKKNKS